MLEILIGMLLIALWMLASAGLQLGALKFQKSAELRLTAVALASELGERMEANYLGARDGRYALATTRSVAPAGSDCTAMTCQPDALATFDLNLWTTRVVAALTAGEVSVVVAAAASGLTTYTISMSWEEPRGRQTYADSGNDAPPTETMRFVSTKVVRDVAL